MNCVHIDGRHKVVFLQILHKAVFLFKVCSDVTVPKKGKEMVCTAIFLLEVDNYWALLHW